MKDFCGFVILSLWDQALRSGALLDQTSGSHTQQCDEVLSDIVRSYITYDYAEVLAIYCISLLKIWFQSYYHHDTLYLSAVEVYNVCVYITCLCVYPAEPQPVDNQMCMGPVPSTSQLCHISCPVECEVSPWGSWGPCMFENCSDQTVKKGTASHTHPPNTHTHI